MFVMLRAIRSGSLSSRWNCARPPCTLSSYLMERRLDYQDLRGALDNQFLRSKATMSLTMKNNDDKVRALENSLFELDGETPEVLRMLVESCSAEEDDYLREQLYRTLCTTYVRQGNVAGLEDAVAQWMDATSLTLHSALWAAQILLLVESPHLALEVLLPFVSSDWYTRSGSARLGWIELLVQVLHELDDTLTAVDVCDKIMALGKSF